MKSPSKSNEKDECSNDLHRQIERSYRLIEGMLHDRPLLALGTVNAIEPKSASSRRTFTWTRKIRAKTVTLGLSPEQAQDFARAIQAHRQLEALLKSIRDASQELLLQVAQDAPKRPSRGRIAKTEGSSKTGLK